MTAAHARDSRHRVMFVDHAGSQGGGQLSLERYMQQPSRFARSLLLFEGGQLEDVARAEGIPVQVVGRELGGWRIFTKLARLARLVASAPADVVVVNSLRSAIVLSVLPKFGKYFVYYLREDLSEGRLRGARRKVVLGWVLPRFDAFIANSKWTASTVPTDLLIRRRMAVAYPLSGIRSSGMSHRAPRDVPPLHIISVSRLVAWKGVHVLLEAIALVETRRPDIQIEITLLGGSDEPAYLDRLRAQAELISSNVVFGGSVPDVAPALDEADVSVVLSTVPEPFGQVVLQGMVAGTVVVATDQGGPAEIINDHVSGLLIQPDSPSALAEAVELLFDDPDLRNRLATSGRDAAARFTDEMLAERLEEAIARIGPKSSS